MQRTNKMLRSVSSRNQRAKGTFRVKHFVQIILLFAISLWLLYQVKHSHDKKKAYEDSNSKDSLNAHESQPEILKFGRKDLPRTMEADPVTETRFEEEEDAEVQHVEREPEHQEAENEEGGGARDDRIDELDHETPEDLAILEDQDHEEGSHEARENSFKGDDVSSAVVHDAQVTEHEDGSVEAWENSLRSDDGSNAAVHDTHVTEHEEGNHVVREISFEADDASSAVVHSGQVIEHEVGSQEAREKSFNGDDASSAVDHNSQVTGREEISFTGDDASRAVVHNAQVTDHGVESQEVIRKSFKADDPSSAVIHNTRVPESETEKGGLRSVDEKHMQNNEKRDLGGEKMANETLDVSKGNDSGSVGYVSKGNETSVAYEQNKSVPNNNLTANGITVDQGDKEVVLPVSQDGSTSNSVSSEAKGNMEQQVDQKSVNVIDNQIELQTNSTSTPSNQTNLQTNSTAALNKQVDSVTAPNHMESQINLTLVDAATDSAPPKNESVQLNSIQDQSATAETARPGENMSTAEDLVMPQTEKSHATQVESGKSLHNVIVDERDSHKDQSTRPDTESKGNSGKDEATK